jgi:hypothetical protein
MLPNRTPIRKKWYLNLEGDRTKFNWFLMEIALEYYDRIRTSTALAAYREQYGERHIAQYCAYHTRRMKKGLLNYLRGRAKQFALLREHVDDFYPNHDDSLNGLLYITARDAWDHMLSRCAKCPQECLNDYSARTTLFDDYIDPEG